MRFRRRFRFRQKTNYSEMLCCLLKADKDAGNPLLKITVLFLCQKLGIKVPDVQYIEVEKDRTPRRLITAKRV